VATAGAVLVADYRYGQRMWPLSTRREMIVGGRDDDIDLGSDRPLARIVHTAGTWHYSLPDGGSAGELRHGQTLVLGPYQVRLLLTDDLDRTLDEDRYLMTVLDPLTRTFRRQFVATHAHRLETPVALLSIDLDRFKHLNDVYGHLPGDRMLVATADRLQAHVRWPELVARIGGEEFLVILPRTTLADAIARAETIRRAMEAPVEIDDQPMIVTVSIGVAMVGTGPHAFREALQVCDERLGLAKQRGRNRVVASSG
jgi:diguanylate cyclase (GGDEF)-like protein